MRRSLPARVAVRLAEVLDFAQLLARENRPVLADGVSVHATLPADADSAFHVAL